jgi:hypothetical protein
VGMDRTEDEWDVLAAMQCEWHATKGAQGRCICMDAPRTERCRAWLTRLGEWARRFEDRPCALACEVVRGIVDVDDPEYAAGIAWAGGYHPGYGDWVRALQMYGPVMTAQERQERATRCVEADTQGNRYMMRGAVR